MSMSQSTQNSAQPPQYLAFLSPDFVGRRDEIGLFVEKILRPTTTTYSIMAVSGNPGVGRTALINQLFQLANSSYFKDSCLPIRIAEQQLTVADVMKKFADQLSENGYRLRNFEQEWYLYKSITQQEQAQREADRKELAKAAAAAVGTVVGETANLVGPPVVGKVLGPISQEGADVAFYFLTRKYEEHQHNKEVDLSNNPLAKLTTVFANDLTSLSRPKTSFLRRQVKPRRVILFLDTFNSSTPQIASWLLDYFSPNVAQNVGLVVATNMTLEADTPDGYNRWQRYRDNATLYSVYLESFTKEETTAYLKSRGITDAANIQLIWSNTQGLPYYLSLLTAHNTKVDIDPKRGVVENVLYNIPEEEKIKRWLALDGALLTKPFNQDDLAALPRLAGQDMEALYDWLIEQPFVRQRGSPHYDPYMQSLFCLFLRGLSPDKYNTTRKALIEHYQGQLQNRVGLDAYSSEDWLPLVLALIAELLLVQSPDERYRCDAIEYVLRAYINATSLQIEDITKVLRSLSQAQPNNPIDEPSRLIAEKLLICIRADLESQEFIDANSYLLERAAKQPAFPHEVLALIYRLRGQAYAALHNYTQAIHDFEEAIALNAKDAVEYGSRGFAYRLSKDYQHAIQDFDESLVKNPNYTWVYAQRALAYKSLGQYDKAINDFNSYLKSSSQSSWAYGQRGKTYRLLKNYPQAILDFGQAISLDPKDAWAYSQCGLVRLWMKDLTQARLDYASSRQIDKKNINYIWVIVWVDMCLYRNDAKAVQQLGDVNVSDKPYYIALICQGIALWFHSDFQQAQAKLEQATQLEPHRWDVHFWQGMVYASIGQDEDAIEEVKQALTLGLPPILLTPLNWYKQSRSNFYEQYVKPMTDLHHA